MESKDEISEYRQGILNTLIRRLKDKIPVKAIDTMSKICEECYNHGLTEQQPEIQRLKGLIEEAYMEGQDAMFYSERGYNYPDDRPMPLTFEQFKQKHGL